MNRKDFILSTIMTTLTGPISGLRALAKLREKLPATTCMPALFVGHGSPMNAIEDNRFSREMKNIGQTLPKPSAILMVSAHWETKGTFVTAQENPPTIHDFGGFPKALYEVQYPASGSKWLREAVTKNIHKTSVHATNEWGYDHGCWSVLINMFPNADVPVVQLSLDYSKPPEYHYELAKELSALRYKGVLMIGSGNIVHNLRMISLKGDDFNEPYGFDWAIEINEQIKQHIKNSTHHPLIHYTSLGRAHKLAIPTPEHYLPLLYILALQGKDEEVTFFNDVAVAGSLTMTSLLVKAT
ncbi:MAG: 4,5-DOPA dioxygenase extradiol [Cytophagaceae bacterium]|nr:4,5-DOPA dioxygenase extradiol [Cytophagaceae bacterium]MDW8456033.1 4,5-DOPA dioxygenase extradiol [Cytophagaceae bacterium]